MATDVVWHSGGAKAATFHRVPDGDRHTACGRAVGDVVDGRPARGQLIPRAEATAAGASECRLCFGHALVRKPIVGDRRNDR